MRGILLLLPQHFQVRDSCWWLLSDKDVAMPHEIAIKQGLMNDHSTAFPLSPSLQTLQSGTAPKTSIYCASAGTASLLEGWLRFRGCHSACQLCHAFMSVQRESMLSCCPSTDATIAARPWMAVALPSVRLQPINNLRGRRHSFPRPHLLRHDAP